eukprot:m51a1_g7456 hypothetical protein (1069) ;mRNA; f:129432-133171
MDVTECLNELYCDMDELTDKAGALKIRTIGDAYLAAVGMPEEMTDHVAVALTLAAAFRGMCCSRTLTGQEPLEFRIGVASGSCSAAVVGCKKITYEVWGTPVVMAQRLQESAAPGEVLCTAECRDAAPSSVVIGAARRAAWGLAAVASVALLSAGSALCALGWRPSLAPNAARGLVAGGVALALVSGLTAIPLDSPLREAVLSVPSWHALPLTRALCVLSACASGISAADARERAALFGPNETTKPAGATGALEWFLAEVREPAQALLLLVAVLYTAFGELAEAALATGVVVLAMASEMLTERRSKSALARASARYARCRLVAVSRPAANDERSSGSCPVADVVPGDVLLLSAGVRVAADALVLPGSSGLACDESLLTGEAAPVPKAAAAAGIPEATPLAERSNVVHAGSVVTRGRGSAVVFATGPRTTAGAAAAAATSRGSKERKTPLQGALGRSALVLCGVTGVASVAAAAVGPVAGTASWRDAVLTGLALLFATIPEELPLLVVAVLAVGAAKLGARGVLARGLRGLETLPLVDTVVTDKTGTLTRAQLRVVSVVLPPCDELPATEAERDPRIAGLLVAWSALRDVARGPGVADVVDDAVREFASQVPPELVTLGSSDPEARRDYISLDGGSKLAAVYADGSTFFVGASECVLAKCEDVPAGLDRALESAASAGTRVICYARGSAFSGAFCFDDPLRDRCADAVAECLSAGIRVLIVTGDHPATAAAAARGLGLDASASAVVRCGAGPVEEVPASAVVYARATPQQKLDVVRSLQRGGRVVAVAGDGYNDAPALAHADVGFSVGERASDAAREASSIAVLRGGFPDITLALREGRRLRENLFNCVAFYLAAKLGLVMSVLCATSASAYPLSPAHVIASEVFMDVGASLAFVAEPEQPRSMSEPPRPMPAVLGLEVLGRTVAGGVGLSACVLAGYCWGIATGDVPRARSVAFVCWLLGHVCLAVQFRTRTAPLVADPLRVLRNVPMLVWIVSATAVAALAVLVPRAASALGFSGLQPRDLGVAACAAAAAALPFELVKIAIEVCKRLRSPRPRGPLDERRYLLQAE